MTFLRVNIIPISPLRRLYDSSYGESVHKNPRIRVTLELMRALTVVELRADATAVSRSIPDVETPVGAARRQRERQRPPRRPLP